VAAERLVRTEHLPARAALEPAAWARGRRHAVVAVLAEQADVVVVLVGLRSRPRGPALLVVLGSGSRPRVPRQHHEGHGHALLRRRVRHAARRLGIRRRARFDRRRITANRALLPRGDDSVSLWPSCTIEDSPPAGPPLENSGATTLMNCLELSRITGSCCVGLPSSTSVDEEDAREIASEYAAVAAAMTWERIWPPRARPLWNRRKQNFQVCLSITKQPNKADGSRTTRSRCYNAWQLALFCSACSVLLCLLAFVLTTLHSSFVPLLALCWLPGSSIIIS
jgi:hypothetical protein